MSCAAHCTNLSKTANNATNFVALCLHNFCNHNDFVMNALLGVAVFALLVLITTIAVLLVTTPKRSQRDVVRVDNKTFNPTT